MIEIKDLTVERDGGYVCIVWDDTRLRLTPTMAAKMARQIRAAAVEIASEVASD